MIDRPVLRQPQVSAVIAQPRPDCILMVRQWRYAVRGWTIEIPAGTCDPGETAKDCARRELVEEFGMRPRQLTEVLRYVPEHGISGQEVVLLSPTVSSLPSPRATRAS